MALILQPDDLLREIADLKARVRTLETAQRITTNIRVGDTTTASLGGGTGVLAMTNAVTVPTSNPPAGGIFYVQAGAVKWRGSSGTVTTVAPA